MRPLVFLTWQPSEAALAAPIAEWLRRHDADVVEVLSERGSPTYGAAVDSAIARCHLVLVLLGPEAMHNAASRSPGVDSFAMEVFAALALGKSILPVVVGDELAVTWGLPEPLRQLSRTRPIVVRAGELETDLAALQPMLSSVARQASGWHVERSRLERPDRAPAELDLGLPRVAPAPRPHAAGESVPSARGRAARPLDRLRSLLPRSRPPGSVGSGAPTKSRPEEVGRRIGADSRELPPPGGDPTRTPAAEAAPPPLESLDCSVFAPSSAAPGTDFLVQAWIHSAEMAHRAAELARAAEMEAELRAYRTLEVAVAVGSVLAFQLVVPGCDVDRPWQHLVWRGKPTSAPFAVRVPHTAAGSHSVVATLRVLQDSIPVGHVKFKIRITGEARPRQIGPRGEVATAYRSVFISYAAEDRAEVLKRVQLLARLRINFFQDLLTLEPGERWARALWRYIDASDLFLLFWSSSAARSEWVREEIRYAVSRKRGDDLAPPEILPVIVQGPPIPKPPDELRHLHFSDPMAYILSAVERAEGG